jgi:hypothetical protein
MPLLDQEKQEKELEQIKENRGLTLSLESLSITFDDLPKEATKRTLYIVTLITRQDKDSNIKINQKVSEYLD